ncbi:hypothetical protein ARSEF4850_009758, partial [Beauveria asiatica]
MAPKPLLSGHSVQRLAEKSLQQSHYPRPAAGGKHFDLDSFLNPFAQCIDQRHQTVLVWEGILEDIR